MRRKREALALFEAYPPEKKNNHCRLREELFREEVQREERWKKK